MSVASRRATAISKDEFLRMFRQCIPPTGLLQKIGVANSGGPDSTCLLFLIHRYLSEKRLGLVRDYNGSVISLTVDHDLQPSSSAMAEHCSKVAQAIGVEHLTYKIPWSDPPFPPRPLPGQAFENTARTARFHGLFQSMTRSNTNVIALGHHSDDQLETALMRLGRGTTELGAGGMKPCRRWGMGLGNGTFGWAGYEGMNRWIVRPMLGDRILATCDANNLEYITDTTNFQPQVTLRNALRQVIKGNPITEPMPTDIAEKLSAIDVALSSYESLSVNLESGVAQIRNAVSLLSEQAADIESKVDSALKRCTLSSPTGTILLSLDGIAHVNDDLTRRAMILRVLRYVSFHPWGSVRADANRRRRSIDQIITKVWHPDFSANKIRMFVAGGGVLWTPVTMKGDRVRTPDRVFTPNIGMDGSFGWLASRQPPLHRGSMEARGMVNSLRIDATEQLAKALKEWNDGAPSVVQVLWDCRFLVQFNIEKIPADLAGRLMRNEGKIMIYPYSRWYWPKVVEEQDETATVLHSKIGSNDLNDLKSIFKVATRDNSDDRAMYWKPKEMEVSSEWINTEWIRSLASI